MNALLIRILEVLSNPFLDAWDIYPLIERKEEE
jgi:hypothetical protein